MDAGNLVMIALAVGLIGGAAYLTMSQSSIPSRFRRLFAQKIDNDPEEPRRPPRRNPAWSDDPDRTNEARELEQVTGVIRSGEAFSIVSGDPSHWGASSFEIEGLITAVAEVETVDAGGNFQFRYCLIESSGGTANTLIVEGDAPSTAMAYLGRAYLADEPIGDVRAGQLVARLQEERRRYRESEAHELPITLPPYENATLIAARYDGRLALLEQEPGKGYLPLSATNPEGIPYSDVSARLDPSGWIIRLIEVGAYVYLLELEPIRLADLTVHHIA